MFQLLSLNFLITILIFSVGLFLIIIGLVGLLLPFLPGTSFIFAGLSCLEKSVPGLKKKNYSGLLMEKTKNCLNYFLAFK